jgi:predicted amidohydrolase
MMICFDFHALPKLLAVEKADIVLYSVGWYGPNEASWFGQIFPRNTVVPNGIHVVAANWSAPSADIEWPGRGHSCVIRRDGTVLAMAATVVGDEIVFADLPVRPRIE